MMRWLRWLSERLMDRYRGTRGLLGRFVQWLDVRWLRRIMRAAREEARR